jgi:DNA-binding NarL/FixJ family response regulator
MSRLTQAERAIALCLLEGMSNRAIALRRSVSERTVANQIAALLRKLRVASRTELVARFAATDLLTM